MIRLLTAGLAIPLFYLLLTKLPPVYFRALAAFVSAIGLYEFLTMAGIKRGLKAATLAAGVMLLLDGTLPGITLPHLLLLCVLAVLSARLFLDRSPEGALRDAGVSLASLVYIPLLVLFQVMLREQGPVYLILLYAAVWSSDGMALYAGSLFGKHKLYPQMSPNKTLEGALGGLVGGAVAVVVINGFHNLMTTSEAIGLGLILSVAGQVGDLVESMFKRDAGVKDSGALFPGHGGVLDKIDASLFAGPVLYLAVSIFRL